MRRFVRMFQPRFAELVRSGAKTQTVRKTPARMPARGDLISLRQWAGAPYRSTQHVILEATVVTVAPVRMSLGPAGQLLLSVGHGTVDEEEFARADGFRSVADMREWFVNEHGLPFDGVLIRWSPKP